VTVDEELAKLEDDIRRLKIEYDAYFGGGLPHPPRETLFRVSAGIKKFSNEMAEMNFGQHFRFNQLAQKYAVYSDLWRKRLRNMEEGRGWQPEARPGKATSLFRLVASDPAAEVHKLNQLYDVWVEAKRQAGEQVPDVDPGVFARFICDKTEQIKQRLGCERIEFRVSVEEGRVKLKAARAEPRA
jgi:hypothetical protein